MKKRAFVTLSFEAIEKMLHLRDCYSLISVRVEPIDETVDFIISGDSLPDKEKRCEIVRVPLAHVLDWELQ
jgi:hypothetical protein